MLNFIKRLFRKKSPIEDTTRRFQTMTQSSEQVAAAVLREFGRSMREADVAMDTFTSNYYNFYSTNIWYNSDTYCYKHRKRSRRLLETSDLSGEDLEKRIEEHQKCVLAGQE